MGLIQYSNGVAYNARLFTLLFKFSKIYNLWGVKERRTFLYQINKFENGYVTIYVRLFYKYSLTITGIKLKSGKRVFIGNIDSYDKESKTR